MSAGWFGGTGKANNPTPPAIRLRVQQSAQGAIRPILCGQLRIAGNLIWFGNFQAQGVLQGSAGGKGGGGSQSGSVTYTYSAYVAIGICAGPIDSVLEVFDQRGGTNTLVSYNMTLFAGGYAQSPWGYLTTNFPTQALNYRGLAYAAFAPISLGSSSDMPNLTFHVKGALNTAVPGIPDADPRDWIAYLLTDPHEGIGFPAEFLSSNALYSSYARATGLLISQALTSQQAAAKILAEIVQASNADFRWSSGLLEIIPYGDEAIAIGAQTQATETHGIPALTAKITVDHAATFVSNVSVAYALSGVPLTVANPPGVGQYWLDVTTGIYTFNLSEVATNIRIAYLWAATASYVPNTTPVYDLVDDDYLPGQSGSSSEPIIISRKPRALVINDLKLEYLDRANAYNPVSIEAKDQAGIDVYGKVPSSLRTFHQFALASAASLSAALQLNREQVIATYTVTLGPWAILADPLDLLTLTRAAMGLSRQGVRIVEVKESPDSTLLLTLEEYLGTATAPAYGKQATAGYARNINADPGPINPPIIFEPTAELLGGASLEIWGGVSGEDTADWGGYNVYASFDGGENYALIGDAHKAPARMGVLSAPLPSVAVNPTGPTIDTTSTLSVDLTESAATLLSASQQDVAALATACWVEGEVLAYRDAALTATSEYDLSYLIRGAYGTEDSIATHAAGSGFVRLDPAGVFRVPYDQSLIGSTVYLKFQSFNQFGGGLEDIANIAAYPYVITGVALKSPLPVVQNVRTQFTDGFQYIFWDDVADFRTGIRYKIYSGTSFLGAQQVGDNAHAPFIAFGSGTYWIQAYCQPVPGLFVYSETPTSITITGNMLVKNLVYTSDQQAAGWPGIMSNGVGRVGPNIQLGGGGDILSASDFLSLPDVLNYGGIIASGTYEVDSADWVDVGYVADCYVNVTWIGVGAPAAQDVLLMTDFLAQPDILGSASTQYVNVKVQIATAIAIDTDLYAEGDLYAQGDLYAAGVAWSDWVDYVPGVYRTRWIKPRLLLTTIDGNTTAIALAFSYEVSVPPRIDHYPGVTVGTGGLTITFEPDDASTAAPFNGGPPVGGVANQPLPFVNISWSGNATVTPVIDSLTLAAVTFHFENSGGTHVSVPGVNVVAEGY